MRAIPLLVAMTVLGAHPGNAREGLEGALPGAEYVGLIVSGSGAQQATTRFRQEPGGAVAGRYAFNESAQVTTEGRIDDCVKVAPLQLNCQWHDRYGSGPLEMFFVPGFGEFVGRWSGDQGGADWLPWTGRLRASVERGT